MNSVRRMRPLLGTYVEIGVKSSDGAPESAIAAAFVAVAEVQALLSFHDTRSDLSRLNQSDGDEVIMHPLSTRVLRLACEMTRASGGLFNCTVGGALVGLGVLPDHGGSQRLDYGNADDIELRGARARLRRPVRVTLDGIAKGYAVDCAIKVMRQHRIKAGWVNAGGDLRVFGDMVLPVHRREMDGGHTVLGGLRQAAIATSCVRVAHDAAFPGCIVGDTHVPAAGVWSVLARTAWRADALTKVASLEHQSKRAATIKRLGGRLVCSAGGAHAYI